MWDRKTLKYQAKQVLKNSYWISVLVCLVAGILAGSGGGGGSSFNSAARANSADSNSFGLIGGGFDFQSMAFAAVILVIIVVVFIFLIAYSIFVANPIDAGKSYFFIRAPYGDKKFGNLFSSFSSGRYIPIVKTMFFTNLYIFLWGLLFIFPGIIKSYQYRMVSYIIAEDPSLTTEQALDLSRRMTDGDKWNMFVLDLSFIGWYLLVPITLGIGAIFLAPYIEATWAQFYFAVKTRVIVPTQDPPYEPNM